LREHGRIEAEAQLRRAFDGKRVAQARAEEGRGMLEREPGFRDARGVVHCRHGVPNAGARTVARQLDERDVDAFEALVTELAIENGVQLFAKQQLESQRTNACTRVRVPRSAVTFVAHGAYQSCRRARSALARARSGCVRVRQPEAAVSGRKYQEIGRLRPWMMGRASTRDGR
jgi:hypothetical protein